MKKSFLLCLLMAFLASWVTVQADPLFFENFEGGSMPTGWTTEGSGSWTIGTGVNSSYPSTAGQGSYNAAIKHGTSGSATKLITPEMDLSAATSAELSFMHVQIDWSGDVDELRVYYRASSTGEWVLLSGQEYTSAVSSWTTEDGIALPNLSATYQIAFEMTDNWGRGVGIDDVKIVQGASCAKPTGVALDGDPTTEDALIMWDEVASAQSYELAYSTNSEFPEAETVVVDDPDYYDGASALMEGLTPGTTYYVRVRALCGGEDNSEWSSTFSFTTKCVAVTSFPWSENFNDLTVGSNIDIVCWKNEHISGGGAKLFQVASATSASADSKAANLPDMSSGTITKLTLPEMSIPAENAYEFLIDVYRNASGSSYPQEGLRIWAFHGSDSTELGFISRNCSQSSTIDDKVVVPAESTTGWYSYNFTIPYAGSVNIVVRGESQWGSATYFDNLKVREKPACQKPSGLEFLSATTNSAVLNWTAGESGENEWDIYYSTENVAPTAETAPSIVGTSAKEISGLTPATTYYVWVRAHCNEDERSEWIGGISFDTKCEAVSALNENFDSYELTSTSTPSARVLPICWSAINTCTSSDYKWYPTIYYYSYTDYSHSKNNSLRFYSYYSSWGSYDPQPQYAILPVMNFDTNKRISFWARGYNANSTIKVGRMTDPEDASTFVSIEEKTLTTEYQQFTVNLTGEGNYIAFMIDAATSSRTYNGAYIDDIVVEDVPSCLEPSGLSFVSSTTNSATFAWTAGGTEAAWDIYYSTENVAPTAETAPLVIATAAKEIPSGLNHSTTYYVWVRAHCSNEDQSPWIGGISFRTACGVADAASWSDDFEDGLYCWRMGNRQSANSNYKPYLYSGAAHDGEYGLYLRAYNANTVPADSSYAVLPEMNYGEKSLKDFTLSFYARSTYNNVDAYNQHLLIGVVEDPADSLATFVQVADVEVTDKYDLYEVSLANYTGAGQHIVLLATIPANYTGESATQFGNFYVDDIALAETPACQALRKITISDVERRSMVVNLVPKINVELGTYDLVCSTTKLDEAALEAADKINVSAASYEINGLDRETKYYIYVRANCGSAWVCDSATTKGLHYTDYAIVADGTTENSYAPVHGINADSKQRVQSIYPAALLTDLQGKTISKLAYSIKSESSKDSWRKGSESFNVRMGITTSENLSSAWASETLTLVYNGVLDASGTTMEIDLATPFAYTDGNLVIEFELPNTTTWESASFYGIEQTGGSRYAEGSSYATAAGSVQNFLPRVEFGYEVALPACPEVTELTASVLGTGTTQEKISWAISDADYLSGFDMIVSESELDAEALATAEITFENIQGNSKDLEGLTPATPYYVYLRAICKADSHNEGNSDWASVEFTTLANCPAVINLALSLGATDSITAVWDRATLEQDKTFRYILSTSRLDEDALEAATPTLVEDTVIAFAGLDHETKYYFYVASACGEQTSAYVEDSIETLPACQAVENLTVVRTKHNLVELSWTSAQFASETQWEVGIVDDNNVHTQIVNERKAVIFGLTAETAYTAYVKAMCGEESTSAEATLAFTTEAAPGACQQIGSGTASSYYFPTNAYYKYSTSEQIYKASEIGKAGKIGSLSLYSNGPANTRTIDVYVAHTEKASFASTSSWISVAEADKVFSGSMTFEVGQWISIPFDHEFNYNGTDNLLVIIDDNTGSYCEYNQQTVFRTYTATDYECLYINNDNTNVNPTATITASGSRSYAKNQIQFCFEAKACPDVANMAVSDITTSSAKVSWDPMGSEMAWNIILSDHALTEFSGAERVETVSKAFAGLNDDTDYFVYVQPANDCPTAEYSMVSFRTVASCLAPINPAVVAESITAHTARVIWKDANEVKAGSYKVVYAKADEFDLENASIAFVNATDTFADLTELQPDTVYKFAVMTNCSSEDPSRYSAVAQFTTAQACFKPTNPGVVTESITANSAVLYWTDTHHKGTASYIIAYGPYSTFSIYDESTYELAYATDTFKLLEGLDEATNYRFVVKSDCGSLDGKSKDWSSYTSFTTTCAVKAVPFSEDFENSDRFSYCWAKGNVESTSSSYIPYRSATAKLNGEYGLYLNAAKTSYTIADSSYAVLPELNFGEEGIAAFQMSFNAKAYVGSYGNYYQHILIGVADDDELTNLEIVADKELTTDFAEYEVSFAAQAGDKRIVLLAVVDPASTASSRYAQIYVDDIYVSHVADCKRPASLVVEVLSANSAKLDWTAGGSEENFQVACVLSGEEPNWDAAELVAGLSLTIDTLSIDNDYDFYVRAYCGETEQSDVRMTSAHVGYCIPAPTSVDNNGITAIAFNEGTAYEDIHPTSAPYYADNKDIEFVAHPDESDSIQITYDTHYTYGTVIWVDWNKNLAFEASEVVYSGESSASYPTTLNCVFAIPATTELGAYRLRIGGADSFFDGYVKGTSSADPDPCGSDTYTIYEDFTLLIVEKPIDPTGLSGAGIDGVVIKRIENDQVVIIRNGEKFTIMGVKIQ